MNATSTRAIVRIARRNIGRSRWRSALIVLLVTLPVAGMVGAASVLQTVMPTPERSVAHRLGEADLVLVAIGFSHPEHEGLIEQLGVELDSRGNVQARVHATSQEGVFAAGDARRGQSLIVWAIAEGRRCARAVDRWLTGRPAPLPLGSELTGAPGDEGILPAA